MYFQIASFFFQSISAFLQIFFSNSRQSFCKITSKFTLISSKTVQNFFWHFLDIYTKIFLNLGDSFEFLQSVSSIY